MRKTVCKKLRKRAALFAHETKAGVRSTIKRYFTGKKDEKGKPIVRDIRKNTIEFTGRQRVYQGLKTAYQLSRKNGTCASVGSFLARLKVPVPSTEAKP